MLFFFLFSLISLSDMVPPCLNIILLEMFSFLKGILPPHHHQVLAHIELSNFWYFLFNTSRSLPDSIM